MVVRSVYRGVKKAVVLLNSECGPFSLQNSQCYRWLLQRDGSHYRIIKHQYSETKILFYKSFLFLRCFILIRLYGCFRVTYSTCLSRLLGFVWEFFHPVSKKLVVGIKVFAMLLLQFQDLVGNHKYTVIPGSISCWTIMTLDVVPNQLLLVVVAVVVGLFDLVTKVQVQALWQWRFRIP